MTQETKTASIKKRNGNIETNPALRGKNRQSSTEGRRFLHFHDSLVMKMQGLYLQDVGGDMGIQKWKASMSTKQHMVFYGI